MPRAKHVERGRLLCHYCNIRSGTTTDHIVPRAFGGPDAAWNYVASCPECNAAKGPNWPTCDCDKCQGAIARFLADAKKRAKALNRLGEQSDELDKGITATERRVLDLRARKGRIDSLRTQIRKHKPTEEDLILARMRERPVMRGLEVPRHMTDEDLIRFGYDPEEFAPWTELEPGVRR
jgi:hypothetical protein